MKTRCQLINILVKNDRNGCYTDADSILEFGRIATYEELLACAIDQELITIEEGK